MKMRAILFHIFLTCAYADQCICNDDKYILVTTGLNLQNENYSRDTEVINIEERRSCRNLTEDFPLDIYGAIGKYADNTSLICGGGDDYNTYDQCWTLQDNAWVESTKMRTKRFGAASLVIDDKVVLVAGGTVSPVSSHMCEFTNSSEFITSQGSIKGPDLQVPLFGHCMVAYGDKIMVIGGNTDSRFTRDTWIHDSRFNFIENGPKLKDEIQGFHACVTLKVEGEETIVILGGRGPRGGGQMFSQNVWKQCKVFRYSNTPLYFKSTCFSVEFSDFSPVVAFPTADFTGAFVFSQARYPAQDKVYKLTFENQVPHIEALMTLESSLSSPVIMEVPKDLFNYEC